MFRTLAAFILACLLPFGTTALGQSTGPAAQTVSPPANYGDALRWYRKAAEAGSSKAQYLLGHMLETGRGQPRDLAASARWYRKSAAQGHALAQFRLGWMYQNGLGLEQDHAGAVTWYTRSAAQGMSEAALNLGYLYERGVGVPHDPVRAQQYYLQAAEKGLGAAQFNLGLLLSAKKGDRWARTESLYWLSLAADQGIADAAAARDAARSTLSSQEISNVERRLSERATLKK